MNRTRAHDVKADIRILSSRGRNETASAQRIVGAGFVIGERHIITCAHVVTDALGSENPDEIPKDRVQFVYALADCPARSEAKVVCWRPPHDSSDSFALRPDDIAILELCDGYELPDRVQPVPFATDIDVGLQVYASGVSNDAPDGVSVLGSVGTMVDGIRWTIKSRGKDHRVVEGCSGAALWSQARGAVIGMIAERQQRSTGLFIPAEDLVKIWPSLRLVGDNESTGITQNNKSELTQPAGTGLSVEEEAYLRRATQSWCNGVVDGREVRKAGPATDVFGFSPGRFLELGAVEINSVQDGTLRESVREQSTNRWLFEISDRPVLLVGRAGAGKTTTLTAAALAHASRWNEAFRRRAQRYDRSAASDAEGIQRMPVVLRAPDLVSDNSDLGTAESLKEAIGAAVLGANVSPQEARAYAEARMSQVSYAVFIDGLDEIGGTVGENAVVDAAINLCDECASGPESLRPLIALTTRPGRVPHRGLTNVELEPPKADQVRYFINRFTNGVRDLENRLNAQVDALRERSDGEILLSTPLFLNAFCALAGDGDGAVSSHATLLSKSISYLLGAGLDVPNLPTLTPETLRALLRNLAVAMQDAGVAQEWFPRGSAVDVMRATLEERGHAIGRQDALATLMLLARQSDLIGIKTDSAGEWCRFHLATFREFLAAEVLVERWPRIRLGLGPILPRAWKASISLSAAILADRSDRDVMELIGALLYAAEAQTGAARADWLTAAISALAETSPSAAALSNCDGDAGHAVRRMLQIVRDSYSDWPLPVERDNLLKGVLQFARRPTARETDEAIGDLLDVALSPRQRWIGAPESDPPAANPRLSDIPTTVSSHARFLEALVGGQVSENLWRHAPKGVSSSTLIVDDGRWASQLLSPAAPVTSVTWFEAVAHARWLTEQGRQEGQLQSDEVIRLLTRLEWQALVRRFANGHRYPWGENELHEGGDARVNWLLDCGLDWPSVPGVFRPYGLQGLYDFGATVRSWVIMDRDGDAVWPPRLEEGELPRVIGGSWACPENHFAVASPGMPLKPHSRDNCVGYRLVRVRGDKAFVRA